MFIALVVIVIVLGLALITPYNNLARLRQAVKESWSGIETELTRRYDLIPNLVETVKGYAKHERETLDAVIAARNSAQGNLNSPEQLAQSEGQLNGAMRSLFALAEAYPDLKANTNFLQLQGELANTESRLATARQKYNNQVRELNTAVGSFPMVLLAGPMGIKTEPYFEVENPQARQNVRVQF
ncbi:protein LemA [Abditibacteriota bacterium]|nr:protein LemA [Abditibacteriota bacterium]